MTQYYDLQNHIFTHCQKQASIIMRCLYIFYAKINCKKFKFKTVVRVNKNGINDTTLLQKGESRTAYTHSALQHGQPIGTIYQECWNISF